MNSGGFHRIGLGRIGTVGLLAGLAAGLAGCADGTGGPAAPSMMDAVTTKPSLPASKGPAQAGAVRAAGQPSPAIAMVNGRPIPYDEWMNLLKRSHGLSAFQQVLAVELARQGAEAKGIRLIEAQLQEAYRREVAEVAGPEAKDAAEAERILRMILSRRNVSIEEFRLSTYRNAYLRRIAEPIVEAGITEEALKVEFDRIYGPKVQIRHIQLSDSAAISKVVQALGRGADFADLARQYSQNVDSVAEGGLLAPFSRLDPGVPAEIRTVAFGLEVGMVSGPVRIDGWTQILKLEKRLAAEPVEYEKVTEPVRRSLTEQLVRQKMQQLLRDMLQSASIQVHDGELGKQFQSLREGK